MGDCEVAALKEALCSQYIIIRKLYNELEVERDASATAASEALSMILRLEREKAAEKMEACQYKRMAEEKMYHVEESLEILEEVMQQKEVEIASLNYQLQTCKSRLSSLGVDVPDVGEMRNSENPCCGGNASLDKMSFHGLVRRNVSFPSLRHDQLCREMDIIDKDSPLARRTIWRKIGDYTNQLSEKCEGSKMPDLLEKSAKQVENLNKKVKDVVQAENVKEAVGSESSSTTIDPDNLDESSPCSWYSAMSSNSLYDLTIGGIRTKLDGEDVSYLCSQAQDLKNIPGDPHISSCLEAESKGSTSHPLFVHSIYEIPDSYEGFSPRKPYKQLLEESIFGTKNMTEICDFMPQEANEYIFRDGNKLSKPRKGPSVHHGNTLSTPTKGPNNLDYHWNLVDPIFEIPRSQAGVEQLKRRLQKLEDQRFVKQDDSETGKEQLKLLRGIHEQLNTIETHLKDSVPKKFPPQDESSLVSIMEAVLSFSI